MNTIAAYLVMLAMLVPVGPPYFVTVEEVLLARIMQGEAGHLYMEGDEAAFCVGWVARNRLESGRYGSSFSKVEVGSGFAGTVRRSRQHYYNLARLVLRSKWDPTNGALYALSQQDVDNLEFDVTKATLVIRVSEDRALFFLKNWDDRIYHRQVIERAMVNVH